MQGFLLWKNKYIFMRVRKLCGENCVLAETTEEGYNYKVEENKGDGMMIVGIGIDIIEVERIRAAVNRNKFVQRIFTGREQNYCESRGIQCAASYAARFAGKEAVMKAFGTGLAGGNWTDIEIVVDQSGRPSVVLEGAFAQRAQQLHILQIHISLTHAREYAAAQAVLWGGDF